MVADLGMMGRARGGAGWASRERMGVIVAY